LALAPPTTPAVSCFDLCGDAIGHHETWIRLKHFPASNRENLQEEFFLQAQTLSISLNFILFSQHDPLTHKCLLCSLALGRAREYS